MLSEAKHLFLQLQTLRFAQGDIFKVAPFATLAQPDQGGLDGGKYFSA